MRELLSPAAARWPRVAAYRWARRGHCLSAELTTTTSTSTTTSCRSRQSPTTTHAHARARFRRPSGVGRHGYAPNLVCRGEPGGVRKGGRRLPVGGLDGQVGGGEASFDAVRYPGRLIRPGDGASEGKGSSSGTARCACSFRERGRRGRGAGTGTASPYLP